MLPLHQFTELQINHATNIQFSPLNNTQVELHRKSVHLRLLTSDFERSALFWKVILREENRIFVQIFLFSFKNVKFPDISLTFGQIIFFPDFSRSGKPFFIFPDFSSFPVTVGTLMYVSGIELSSHQSPLLNSTSKWQLANVGVDSFHQMCE